MKQKRRRGIPIDILYLPALFLLIVFVAYPLASGIQISFTNWNGYSRSYQYLGLANYRKMFRDKMFYTALKNTILYGVGSTVLQVSLGTAYALLLQKRFHGQTAARVIIYLPAMIASLIMGYISYFIVQYNRGALNDIMMLFGRKPVDWMADGTRAVWIIVIINALQFVGKAMIVMIAGLQGIPESYTEAAAIDGAGYLQQLRYITLPLLLPAITTSVVLNLIGGLKLFGVILSTTSGGPGYASHSLSTLINYLYFENQNAGYSATVGLFLFLFIMAAGTVVRRFLEKRMEELE